MRITKYTHACVRVEHDGRVLVIDPGMWSEPHALRGADAILVTHEHADHADRLRLAGLGAPVYAPADARIDGVAFTPLVAGADLTVAGFRVRAVGGEHAVIYGTQPQCANLGYVVDDALYHPGDSLYRPAMPVETLCVPAQASWLKTAEAIDFIRAVGPERAFQIHDGQLNDRGIAATRAWLEQEAATKFRYLAPLETL